MTKHQNMILDTYNPTKRDNYKFISDYTIYSDGGFDIKEKVGSAAYIILDSEGQEIHQSSRVLYSVESSNEVELQAIVDGLKWLYNTLPRSNEGKFWKVRSFTDSIHAMNSMTMWYKKWELKGYTTYYNEPLAFIPLKKSALNFKRLFNLDVKYVDGKVDEFHAQCDSMCVAELEKVRKNYDNIFDVIESM